MWGRPRRWSHYPTRLIARYWLFGAFTGAGLLRSDPPDRYVFNYRASYEEETAAVVNYLVKAEAAIAAGLKSRCLASRTPTEMPALPAMRKNWKSVHYEEATRNQILLAELPAQHSGCR